MLGSHTRTTTPTAQQRTPTTRPEGGRLGWGGRLTSDAPHGSERAPPRGRPSATPTARNTGPQGRTLWGRCWAPTPAPTEPGTHGPRNPGGRPPGTGSRGTAPDTRRQSQSIPATGTDSAGPRTPTLVPTARGQRAPAAPGKRAAGGGRAPGLGRPSQRGHHGRQGGEHLMATRTNEPRPAKPAYELPNPRLAAPTARTPATGNLRPIPCS